MTIAEAVDLPDALDRHEDRAIPGRAEARQPADDGIAMAFVLVAVLFGIGLARRCDTAGDAMRRRDGIAHPVEDIGAEHGLALRCEEAPLAGLDPVPAAGEGGGRADDRIAAADVAEGDRCDLRDTLVLEQGVEQAAVDQRQGVGLDIDCRHQELRLAAGRADDQVEIIGGRGRAAAQRPFLRSDGDAGRDGQRDQQDDRRCGPAQRAQIGQHHGEGIHHAARRCGAWDRSRR